MARNTQKADRVTVAIRRNLHAVLNKRKRETGISVEMQVNELLELGMRMKRMLPSEAA